MANLQSLEIDESGFLKIAAGTTAERPNSPEIGMIRYNTDRESYPVLEFYDGSTWKIFGEAFTSIDASGGTVSDIDLGGAKYRVHSFTNTGSNTFTVNSVGDDSRVEYLIVAGGGGGGGRGGGGGAGGFLTGVTSVSAGSYTITVGAGGDLGDGNGVDGTNGGDSSAFGETAQGGGGGGGFDRRGLYGASGGGPGRDAEGNKNIPGGQVANQGNMGGYCGQYGDDSNEGCSGAGGGGGAGGRGGNGTMDSGRSGVAWVEHNGERGGSGGVGLPSDITGEWRWYAGGGGGGNGCGNSVTRHFGLGGRGGGGNGRDTESRNPTPGEPNTGGGGGGGGDGGSPEYYGRDGGSGIVVIRYRIQE